MHCNLAHLLILLMLMMMMTTSMWAGKDPAELQQPACGLHAFFLRVWAGYKADCSAPARWRV